MHSLQFAGSRSLIAGNYLIDHAYDGPKVDILSIRHERIRMRTPDIEADEDL